MSKRKAVIACGGDRRYGMQIAVTLFSLLKNLAADVTPEIYVMDGGVVPEEKAKIDSILRSARKDVDLHWLEYDLTQFKGFYKDFHLSEATYMRLLLPERLASLDKIIYLDSDIIVRGDITPLYETALTDEYVAAVSDYMVLHNYEGKPYFNAGVMLINLDRFRETRITDKIFHYLRLKSDHHDQDCLNVLLSGQWKPVDYWWNLQTAFMYPDTLPDSPDKRAMVADGPRLRDRAVVVHFTGHKPWNSCLRHPFRPEYHEYLRKSGWLSPSQFAVWQARYFYNAVFNKPNMPPPRHLGTEFTSLPVDEVLARIASETESAA